MSRETARPLWFCFVVLSLVAFVLNWFWEMAQMRAYTEMASAPWASTLMTCTWASIGDVAFTFIIYGIGALATGQSRWGMTGRWHVMAAAAILGAVFATAVEWNAQVSGRWSYTEAMPMVPMFGVGLWPFLQLTVTVPIAFLVGGWWASIRSQESKRTPRP